MRGFNKLPNFDPFSSHLSKYHPKRVTVKILTIIMEKLCSLIYSRLEISYIVPEGFKPEEDGPISDNMTTTSAQRQLLEHILDLEESKRPEETVVELGAWRGDTTCFLAERTQSEIIAVDRYFSGWPEAKNAKEKFKKQTAKFKNIKLIESSTVSASNIYYHGPIKLLFIDAQHNFINTYLDYRAWKKHLSEDSYVAFHDVDSKYAPGTRLAAYLVSKKMHIFAHINNIVVFKNLKMIN